MAGIRVRHAPDLSSLLRRGSLVGLRRSLSGLTCDDAGLVSVVEVAFRVMVELLDGASVPASGVDDCAPSSSSSSHVTSLLQVLLRRLGFKS